MAKQLPLWQWVGNHCVVRAKDKSDARAIWKRVFRLRRLPVGTKIERVAE